MLFNSYEFIFIFLPIVFGGFALLRRLDNLNWAIAWLTLSSLFFYGWWKWEFLALILISIAVNLIFGKLLLEMRLSDPIRRLIVVLGIVFNLGVLAFFKYADFFISNVNLAVGTNWGLLHILLPIGISFITFQKIAFVVDAYRGHVRGFSALNFSFFVTFFPQLIAGPIVHHAEIMPQLKTAPRRNLSDDLAVGLSIFIVGLFKKVIIADTLAVYADAGYGMVAAGQRLDFAAAWVTVFAYCFQIYYDFSGYSEMAVGLGRMFGIKLPINFYSPYKAHSIIDFWRRWHITLSRFLRDYLYIPLGGNRRGYLRRYIHLIVVMVLGGLWHGANWTFVAWGFAHGAMLMINHAWAATPLGRSSWWKLKLPRFAFSVLTFLAVTLAWVPFRSATLSQAATMIGYLSPFSDGALASTRAFLYAQFAAVLGKGALWFQARELWPPALPPDYLATGAKPVGLVLLAVALLTFLVPNTYRFFGRFDPALGLEGRQGKARSLLPVLNGRVAAVLGVMFVLSVMGLTHVSPFLYFQF